MSMLASLEKLYNQFPGTVIITQTINDDPAKPDCTFEWKGGPIAIICSQCAAGFSSFERHDGLPFRIRWEYHDEPRARWFIRNLGTNPQGPTP